MRCVFIMEKSINNEKKLEKERIYEERKRLRIESGEDTTKYGEFVCSYFAWLTPEEQKRKAESMSEMTDK